MKSVKTPLFFHDKPVFGMEIGHGSLKVMQLEPAELKSRQKNDTTPAPLSRSRLIGYGAIEFDKKALRDGNVTNPEIIAAAAASLFKNNLVGSITTQRVALAIPAYRAFTRSLRLPNLQQKELDAAIELEAEQYISLPLDQLYLDYHLIKKSAENIELLMVAAPRTIVDSYLELTQILGLEAVLIEPTLSSLGRLFSMDDQSDVPSIIVNLGSVSSDISIYDNQVLVTGTVQAGGEDFTESIKEKLDISLGEAARIKTRYGLGVSKHQAQIKEALEPILQEIVREIRRMIRYYEERYGTARPISQIITLGGGANMPGLDNYLIEAMHVAVRHSDPWQYLDPAGLQPPEIADRPMYSTAAGLGLIRPKELFRHD